MSSPVLCSIPEAIEDLKAGKFVILVDDEDRENEGDLVLAAQFVTPEAITFLLSVARGYMCLSLTEADCDRLELGPQSAVNTSARGTPFTVSIDGHPKHGFTTGVSARERARTIQMAIDPASTPGDFVRPGHINPLRSRDGGVLVRVGQTEGSLDLCRLAGLKPAAVIIEIMRDDGEMARLPDLVMLGQKHGIKICSVAQIVEHRLNRESLVRRIAPESGTPVNTRLGAFNLIAFESMVDPLPHVALCVGGVGDLDAQGRVVEDDRPTLVRMHRRSLMGDVFEGLDASGAGHSTRDTLRASMAMLQREGRGALVYLRPEGANESQSSDSALENHLQRLRLPGHLRTLADAPVLQGPASSTPVPAYMRDFGIGGQILRQLGLKRLRLITSHARPMPGLEAFGLEVTGHVPADLRAE